MLPGKGLWHSILRESYIPAEQREGPSPSLLCTKHCLDDTPGRKSLKVVPKICAACWTHTHSLGCSDTELDNSVKGNLQMSVGILADLKGK